MDLLKGVQIFNAITPLLLMFMKLIEGTKASGEVKKEAVVDMVKITVPVISKDLVTGGAKETWEIIEEPLTREGGLIDMLAAIFFGSKPAIKVDWWQADEDHAN